ncbi:UvrD-helicase domain-containing protein [Sinanaerobacter chloroacetimidivorans]|uniref:ATP-dependent helicase n=1 Tax=Sinanaerobacter chloroacetimidivorans TaxID=2818044 RepID=A0A8J7W1J2_9FIRM|nr:UvrD-helicase domain-containing protein [Sinanaerobacter chloroacetimidivorans]MBR0597480.1 ATP-dependent helicase [Sinanaerobacter chloroacetimidivorans]
MATKTINPLELCQDCIDKQISFVLQGGAGSGKTESLKDLLLYLSIKNPSARVVCITHTNNAVQEIQERIGDRYPVSTIHAFLHGLIKDYKKNIKCVIPALYMVSKMERLELGDDNNEKEYKKAEYERYKKIYNKFADKLYSVKKETCGKVIGKKEYDNDSSFYNNTLNDQIDSLNEYIKSIIEASDQAKIHYNETKFDSLGDFTYGHDGLLIIAHLLLKSYPVLGRIIKDKYDYIFIDEYQDTKLEVIQDLLALTKQKDGDKKNLALCLFGDSMQAIYSDGIGSVNKYTDAGDLVLIPKADNYRCSYEIINLINNLRLDDIKQEVAFAKLPTGEYQTEMDRHGNVRILYSICDQRPSGFSSLEDKEKHLLRVNKLINEAKKDCENAKILMLTNKAIAEKEGFKYLYKVFDDRYVEVSDRMDNYLKRIHISDICEICNYYEKKNYNPIIKTIRSGGYVIHSLQDKAKLQDIIGKLLTDKTLSIYEAFQYAVSNKLIKPTEACQNTLNSNKKFIQELASNVQYQKFKKLYLDGMNTYNRIKDAFAVASEEEFDYYKNLYKKEIFIETFFSQSIKFADALNYTRYLNENSNYITMHKTKGSSIDSVIVVMEEFYWNEYDFSLIYTDNSKQEKWENSQKLIYVACSRARKALSCIRLLLEDEVEDFLRVFPDAVEVKLEQP